MSREDAGAAPRFHSAMINKRSEKPIFDCIIIGAGTAAYLRQTISIAAITKA